MRRSKKAGQGKSAEPQKVKTTEAQAKPFYFLSYSTGEPQIELFAECLELVFKDYFDLVRTPSALEPGGSQHDVILERIGKCAFGVVCLDGLRPNVVFEYGAMKGAGKSVLPFKEVSAKVDIDHFFAGVAGLAVASPPIDLDKHFSNTKDRFYASWNRFEVKKTVKTIWDAYSKMHDEIAEYVAIPEPKI